MKLKRKIINNLWAVGVLLIAGFCLSACDNKLDIQQVYPFTVETMPVPKAIKLGEQVEIRCTLTSEGNYTGSRYTLRFFSIRRRGNFTNRQRRETVGAERPICCFGWGFQFVLHIGQQRTTKSGNCD